jgi:hypothetical protein
MGTNRVQVRAVAVDPGDWDPANNVYDKEILVSTLTPDFDVAWAEALVYDKNNTTFQQLGRYVNTTFTGGYDWLYEELTDTDGDVWSYSAGAASVPWIPATVSASLTDGVVSWTAERAVSGCDDFAIGQVNGRTIWTSVTGCAGIFIQAGGFSGTVTYTSRLLARTFTVKNGVAVHDGPAQYVYNNVNTEDVNGANIFNGSAWTIDVKVSAGEFTFSTPLSFTLDKTLTAGETIPTQCFTGTGVQYCESSSWNRIARNGETTFVRQQ